MLDWNSKAIDRGAADRVIGLMNQFSATKGESIKTGNPNSRLCNLPRAMLALATAVITSAMCGCGRSDVPQPSAAPVETNASDPSTRLAEPVFEPPNRSQPTATSRSSRLALSIGDPAPPLRIDHWVTGEPIDQIHADRIYVIDFWASWCGPCLVSMPHFSELQQEYGDQVAFVGVTREDIFKVKKFLNQVALSGEPWSDVIQYRLASAVSGATHRAYMGAANIKSLPITFVISGDGVVEWIGHPIAIDTPLKQIVAGTFDRQLAAAEFQQRHRLNELTNLFLQSGGQNPEELLAALDRAEAEFGRTATIVQYRTLVSARLGRDEELAALRSELVKLVWDNPAVLNETAWAIANSTESRQLKLAQVAAQRASQLRDHKDPAILDTLARVHYELGNLDQAIHWQRIAVQRGHGIPSLQKNLEKYLSAQQNDTDSERDDRPSDDEP